MYKTTIQFILLCTLISFISCAQFPLGLKSTFSDGTTIYSVSSNTIYKFDLVSLAAKQSVPLSIQKDYAPEQAIFNPNNANQVFLFSAQSLDMINLSTGVVTSVGTGGPYQYTGVGIDSSYVYLGTYNGTTTSISRYNLNSLTSVPSIITSTQTSSGSISFLGLTGGLGYLLMTGQASNLIVQSFQASTFSFLAPVSINYPYTVSSSFLLPNGIALFNSLNNVVTKYIFSGNSIVAQGSPLQTAAYVESALQDNMSPYKFFIGTDCDGTAKGGSCLQVNNMGFDFTSGVVATGDSAALPSTTTQWTGSSLNWNTNGLYTMGYSNGIVFYTIVTNSVLTSVCNYHTSGDASSCTSTLTATTAAPIVTPAGCWTCAAGWTHWYSLGWSKPSNGDSCQCIQNAPAPATDSHGCWACPTGWSHWYTLGLQQPTNGDRCQCISTSRKLKWLLPRI